MKNSNGVNLSKCWNEKGYSRPVFKVFLKTGAVINWPD